MQPFRNILVGVDLTQYDATTLQPSTVARQVVHQAQWLAGKMGSRLTFFSALNLTVESLPHLGDAERQNLANRVEHVAEKILNGLVAQAREHGIEAENKLVLGRPWLEIIRRVLRGKHDLLLVGTRDRKGLGRMILGSTAIRLIRRCPCPVWVAKPDGGHSPLRILVASDLTPVSDKAMSLATQLAQITPAEIHLLHVVDFPLDHIWSTGLTDAKEQAYRQSVRQQAQKALEAQVRAADASGLSPAVQVHLINDVGGLPDEGILGFIQKHKIDLLVMGTIGRSGFLGVMIGNTAERLLPELTCSLLAVKPEEFVCPVA
jgi:universal stress protein E